MVPKMVGGTRRQGQRKPGVYGTRIEDRDRRGMGSDVAVDHRSSARSGGASPGVQHDRRRGHRFDQVIGHGQTAAGSVLMVRLRQGRLKAVMLVMMVPDDHRRRRRPVDASTLQMRHRLLDREYHALLFVGGRHGGVGFVLFRHQGQELVVIVS